MKRMLAGITTLLMVGSLGYADTLIKVPTPHDHQESQEAVNKAAAQMVDEILRDNEFYRKAKGKEFFEAIKNGQKPRATVVSCSDSRVQMTALDATPENDLFVIRNIGNQISSNEGSVAYGVHHLHTPLLLIVGHTRCGAIKAAMSDYAEESSAIRKEVDSLSLSIKKGLPTGHTHGGNEDWLKGVEGNVNMQVQYALQNYAHEVKEGSLTIIGAVFDLADDRGEGGGKLSIININGETNPKKLQANPLVKTTAGH